MANELIKPKKTDFYDVDVFNDNFDFINDKLNEHISHIGNNDGQIPISNGIVCQNLNAEFLQGKHAADFVGKGESPTQFTIALPSLDPDPLLRNYTYCKIMELQSYQSGVSFIAIHNPSVDSGDSPDCVQHINMSIDKGYSGFSTGGAPRMQWFCNSEYIDGVCKIGVWCHVNSRMWARDVTITLLTPSGAILFNKDGTPLQSTLNEPANVYRDVNSGSYFSPKLEVDSGTWTPQLYSGTDTKIPLNGSVNQANCWWHKTGNLVTINGVLSTLKVTTASTNKIHLTGLPFMPKAGVLQTLEMFSKSPDISIFNVSVPALYPLRILLNSGSSYHPVYGRGTSSTGAIQLNTISTASTTGPVFIQGSYITNY